MLYTLNDQRYTVNAGKEFQKTDKVKPMTKNYAFILDALQSDSEPETKPKHNLSDEQLWLVNTLTDDQNLDAASKRIRSEITKIAEENHTPSRNEGTLPLQIKQFFKNLEV